MESQEFIVSLNDFPFCGERGGDRTGLKILIKFDEVLVSIFSLDQETTFFALNPVNGDIPAYSDS